MQHQQTSNIKSIIPIGFMPTNDLEVNHSDHQYYLSNGMLTSNSHATLYSMISYRCAYLKYHYPVEFFTALLKSKTDSNAKNASEKMTEIKNKLRELKIKIVPPDVNTSTLSWSIVDDNTVMTGLDALKFMGTKAIPELIEKRPFKSFKDLIQRTESSKVTASAIQAMAASGSLDCFGMDRKRMYTYAGDYRAKLKAHIEKAEKVWVKEYAKENGLKKKRGEDVYRNSSGNVIEIPVVSQEWISQYCESFNYPFPDEAPWTLQEMFAFEEYYMGEGISGDNFDRYPKFFDRNKTVPFEAVRQMFPYKEVEGDERTNRKANTQYLGNVKMRPLEAIITNVFSFIVKKEDSKIFGQEMARITVQDPWGDESTILCFPEAWLGFKDRIKELKKGVEIGPGLAIKFLGSFQWENDHTNSFILTEILDVKGPPVKPADKSKKVKMPRGASYVKVKGEDVEEMSKDELLDVLEEEAIDDGIGSIEDEE
jgi:DNA polymerase III alpha subunit